MKMGCHDLEFMHGIDIQFYLLDKQLSPSVKRGLTAAPPWFTQVLMVANWSAGRHSYIGLVTTSYAEPPFTYNSFRTVCRYSLLFSETVMRSPTQKV